MSFIGNIRQRVGQRVTPFQTPPALNFPIRLSNPQISTNLLFKVSEVDIASRFTAMASPLILDGLGQADFEFPEEFDRFPVSFEPLLPTKVDGKIYPSKQKMYEGQPLLFPDVEKTHVNRFKKAYKREKTPGSISSHQIQTLTIWDLLFPLLLPPLNLEFNPQFEIGQLRNYQIPGVNFLIKNHSALLADEMGTGKTIIAAVALKLLFRLGKAKKALIVCPMSVLRQWQIELEKWASELEITTVRGTPDTRKLDWKYPAHVFLTTYGTVKSDFLTSIKKNGYFLCPGCHIRLRISKNLYIENNDISHYHCPECKHQLNDDVLEGLPTKKSLVETDTIKSFDVVILDEAQYIKNPGADRSRAVKLLSPEYRWAMTGTPLEGKLDDLVSIFSFVKPNHLKSWGLTPKLASELIKPHFLRRLKKDVLPDLPEKTKDTIWLELDEDQKRAYKLAEQEGLNELESLGEKVTRIHIFLLITKWKQICNFATGKEKSPKTQQLIDQLEQIKESGQKLVVFSQFLPEGILKLEKLLREKNYGVVAYHGSMNLNLKNLAVDKFKNDPNICVFLGSVKTAGTGLDGLQEVASYAIHFDHWWNPATMWQAEDRIHRYGQKGILKDGKKQVNIYSYWMRDTIEERIYQILQEKGLLFDEVINGLSEETIDAMISVDEWLDILGVKTKPKSLEREAKPKTSRKSVADVLASLKTIDPLDFETLVKEVFSKIGFTNVRTTKTSHDGGVDILGYKRALGGTEKVIAQCKRMETVGVDAGRELLGVLASDQSVSKGYLITSGMVSPECRTFCEKDGRLAVIEGPLLATYVSQFEITV